MTFELVAQERVGTGKGRARQLRREGLIPGICYGTDVKAFSVAVDPEILSRLILTSPRGRNTVLDLRLGSDLHRVMVHQIQRDPVKRSLLHVDFLAVRDTDEVVIDVPVHRVGRAAGEEMGGRLLLVRRTVSIRCQVKDIPDAIEHDVADMHLGDTLRASELVLPPGCEVVYDTDFTVLSVVRPRGIDELEEGAEEAEEAEEAESEAEEGSE